MSIYLLNGYIIVAIHIHNNYNSYDNLQNGFTVLLIFPIDFFIKVNRF